MNQIGRSNSLKTELTAYYKNGYLKTYLSQVTDQELAYIQLTLLVDSWKNLDDNAIVELVAREKRRRILGEYLDPSTSEFITEQYSGLAEKIPLDNFKNSVGYLMDKGIDYVHLVKWCPAMMNVELVHKIYGYLKSYGLSDSDIFKTLTSNSNKLIYFTQMIEQQKYGNQISLEEDKNFERFVNYTAECLKNSKSGTESYRKMLAEEMNFNREVLRKLQ